MKGLQNNYCVYKHTSPKGKVYIGITGGNPIKRWGAGHNYKNNPHFWNAIIKYGWQNFSHEILFDGLTKEQAEQREIELIAQHKSNQYKYGYNRDNGGYCNGSHSESTKNKIRDTLIGHTVAKETHDKMCSIFIEYNSETKTLKEWADEYNLAYKTLYARLYIYNTPIEQALKCPQLRGKKLERAICQYTKDMVFVERYNSGIEAFRQTGIRHINSCANGNRKTAGGFIWRYE